MNAATFDTLQYAKQLKAVDVPEKQAELQAQVLGKALDEQGKALAAVETKMQELATDTKRNAEQMASKADALRLDGKIDKLEAKLEAKIDKLDAKIDNAAITLSQKIEISHKDLLIKLGGSIGVALGIILAAMRWMPHA